MTKQRAQEIKTTLLDPIDQCKCIPRDSIDTFFQMYNTEVSPGRFDHMPCSSCNQKLWAEMVEQTKNVVNAALQPKKQKQ